MRDQPAEYLEVGEAPPIAGGRQAPDSLPAPKTQEPPPRLPRLPKNGLAPPLDRRRLQYNLAQIVLDTMILVGCFAALSYGYLEPKNFAAGMLPGMLLLPIFLTLALQNRTYSSESLTDWKTASWRVGAALLIAFALLNFFAFFAKMNSGFSRVVFVGSVMLGGAAMSAARYVMTGAILRNLGPSALNRLVIQAGGPPVDLPHSYVVDAKANGLVPDLDDPHSLNRFAHYIRNMDQVLVSCDQSARRQWSELLKASGVHGEVISDFAREIGALGIVHYDKHRFSTLLVSVGTLSMRDRAVKRIFDLAMAALALLALAPLMLLFALLIRLEDGGPVFFRQRRMGRGNRFFDIYKFRSMRVEKLDADGNRSSSKDDDRVTRIGRFIRKTSIDELPQLLNVILGDMSLVGPRPHALGSQAGAKLFWEVNPKYWQRHTLRPGITGLAQVRGYRGATDTEADLVARLQADLEYMNGWSLWRDVRLLLATVQVLVHDRAF